MIQNNGSLFSIHLKSKWFRLLSFYALPSPGCGAHGHSGTPFQSAWRGKKDYATLQGRLLMSQSQEEHSSRLQGLANYMGGWHISTAASPQGRGNGLNEYPTSKICHDFHFLYFFSELLEFSKWVCITFICRKDWSKFLFYRVIVSFFKRKSDRREREREKNRDKLGEPARENAGPISHGEPM